MVDAKFIIFTHVIQRAEKSLALPGAHKLGNAFATRLGIAGLYVLVGLEDNDATVNAHIYCGALDNTPCIF